MTKSFLFLATVLITASAAHGQWALDIANAIDGNGVRTCYAGICKGDSIVKTRLVNAAKKGYYPVFKFSDELTVTRVAFTDSAEPKFTHIEAQDSKGEISVINQSDLINVIKAPSAGEKFRDFCLNGLCRGSVIVLRKKNTVGFLANHLLQIENKSDKLFYASLTKKDSGWASAVVDKDDDQALLEVSNSPYQRINASNLRVIKERNYRVIAYLEQGHVLLSKRTLFGPKVVLFNLEKFIQDNPTNYLTTRDSGNCTTQNSNTCYATELAIGE